MSGYPSESIARFDSQFAETATERAPRFRKSNRRAAGKCEECGINPADHPSTLCPGCEAYRSHQR